MKIEVLKAFNDDHGAARRGETVSRPKVYADRQIARGFAKEATEPKASAAAPAARKPRTRRTSKPEAASTPAPVAAPAAADPAAVASPSPGSVTGS